MKIIQYPLMHGGGHQIPDRIVVHSMGEYIKYNDVYTHASEFLDICGYSAHVLIAPNGDQWVCRPDNRVAWHALGFNENSLGIEFLVPGKHDYSSFLNTIKKPYINNKQMESGLNAINKWQSLWDIKNINRHSDLSPGRKVDPGDGFPWEHFLRSIYD
jgi:N-acetyl-anhydromuramyl-L-alanine amidase AmpD